MDLGQFVNLLIGREPKYEQVSASYSGNGAFTLSAERNNMEVRYVSQVAYTVTTASPLLSLFSKKLGGPVEIERMAPAMMIEDFETGETAHILYDKDWDTIRVSIQKGNKRPLQIIRYLGHQIICNDSSMSDKEASRITSNCVKVFKKQQRLLDVSAYQKKALETAVQQASV